jgi:hypothetical protein
MTKAERMGWIWMLSDDWLSYGIETGKHHF